MSIFWEKLLSVCSSDISSEKGQKVPAAFHDYPLVEDLINLLNKRNGFYGFESALHVFSVETDGEEIGLIDWNDNSLWIDCYDDLARNAIFFAEDVFGGQFCIKKMAYTRSIQKQALLITLRLISMNGVKTYLKTIRS